MKSLRVPEDEPDGVENSRDPTEQTQQNIQPDVTAAFVHAQTYGEGRQEDGKHDKHGFGGSIFCGHDFIAWRWIILCCFGRFHNAFALKPGVRSIK